MLPGGTAARPDGPNRITGRLVDAQGEPMAHVWIHAVGVAGNVAGPPYSGFPGGLTSEDGVFAIGGLGRGSFLIGIGLAFAPATERGRTVYTPLVLFPGTRNPGESGPIVIGGADRVDIGVFTLPADVQMTTVAGTVRDAAGEPLARVHIVVMDDEDDGFTAAGPVLTDAGGGFRLTLLAGRQYRLFATLVDQDVIPGRCCRSRRRPACSRSASCCPLRVSAPERRTTSVSRRLFSRRPSRSAARVRATSRHRRAFFDTHSRSAAK
jgi:hypothetical protein